MKLLAQLLEANLTAKLKHAVLELQDLLQDNEYIHDLDVTLEHDTNDSGVEPDHEVTLRINHLGPGEFIENAKVVVTPTSIIRTGEEGLFKEPLARVDAHSPAETALYHLMPKLIGVKIVDALKADHELMQDIAVIELQVKSKELKLHISSHDGDAPRSLIFTWSVQEQGFKLVVGLIDMSLHGYADYPDYEDMHGGAEIDDKATHQVYKTADSVIDFVKERYDAK